MRNDERGFTLAELLVTCAIVGLVMAGLLNLYMTSNTVGQTSGNKAEAQQGARAAMLLEEDLRTAGSGCPAAGCPTPPPGGNQLKIVAATPTSITFWADVTSASTRLFVAANAGATTVTVVRATGFVAGDTAILSNGGVFQVFTVNAVNVGANTVTLSAAISAVTFPTGAPIGALLGHPRQITYSSNQATQTLCKDDGTGPLQLTPACSAVVSRLQALATGVQAFQLTYFDAADAAIPPANLAANLQNIRRVQIQITAQSAAAQNRGTFTVTSSVRPRNL